MLEKNETLKRFLAFLQRRGASPKTLAIITYIAASLTVVYITISIANTTLDFRDHLTSSPSQPVGTPSGDIKKIDEYQNSPNSRWKPLPTADSPSPRRNASMFWTGKDICIWGGDNFGSDGDETFNDGACISLNSKNWTAISKENAPIGRTEHAAIWTGKEFCVWGGLTQNSDPKLGPTQLTDGACYDLSKWRPISKVNAHKASRYIAHAWTGDEWCMWSGSDSTASQFSYLGGSCYDPKKDHWRSLPTVNAPTSRKNGRAVWTGNSFCVWGGWDADTTNTGGCIGKYSSRQWETIPTVSASDKRTEHSMVWTGSEICVWGGHEGDFFPKILGGCFSPKTSSWRNMSTEGAPSERKVHQAVNVGKMICFWGGQNDGPSGLRNGACWSSSAGTWTEIEKSGAPTERKDHSSVSTGTHICIWGGYGANEKNSLALLDTGSCYKVP